MRALAYDDYQALRSGAQVIEADASGDKVLLLPDGNFIKLFRRKRLISSAALNPYAKRFASNAKHLQQRGIPCPHVLQTWRVAAIKRDLVHYEPLPGKTLRQLIGDPAYFNDLQLLARFGRFVADLHRLGIYFRSVHLGNVVLTPDDRLGLIDIADLRTYRRGLPKSLCLRNFQHMRRYKVDLAWLLQGQEQGKVFFDSYAQHSEHDWGGANLAQGWRSAAG
ncbi:toluene tolerance protein [Pseudomonas sp. HR96]|uniref:toluene tolerance protein n=1 Tax=Pseudomonas sp. HR96 TaxID=1027966 RepID=UPI002A7503B5|nr:toluene tolerance protein [Pseudomonas sp. HR96]WPO99568.1 toluene tolerance protein [Pseudomonas sp. HR96]